MPKDFDLGGEIKEDPPVQITLPASLVHEISEAAKMYGCSFQVYLESVMSEDVKQQRELRDSQKENGDEG